MSTPEFYHASDSDTNEIVEYLRAKLGIPKYVTDFQVYFSFDDVIKVSVNYLPTKPNKEV